ncbi:ATP-binding protein [Arundinibacter roseus]|uniref:histidine kinase n=1 Tax=Arundinibacter roseus TaxID=2070510 RepID=A0A4R4K9A6_9BACT|nr:ATP-binding protein [Arundinibacter roseus]TDB64063.1 response regulator [Arundinibacter roseus]
MRLLLFSLLICGLANGQSIQLTATTKQPVILTENAFFFKDSTSALRFSEAQKQKFLPVPQSNFLLPFSDNTYWYICNLTNTISTNETWYIQWENPVVELITCYVEQPDGTFSEDKGGTFIPKNERNYTTRDPTFRINLPAGQTKKVYLKVKSQRGHRVDILLFDEKTYQANRVSNASTNSFFNGLVSLRLFYILLLAAFAVKEITFRYYSLMLLLRSLSYWGLKTSLGNFLTSNAYLATLLNFSSYHLLPIGYMLVIKVLLPFQRFPGYVRHLVHAIMGVDVLLLVFIWLDYSWYWLQASTYLVICSQLLVFGLYVFSVKKKYAIDWYYSVPFLLGIMSYFFLLLSQAGLLNALWVFEVANFFFISEIFVFGLFLGKIILSSQQAEAASQREVVFNQAQTHKLKELDALKSNFFANISHEFRTPITLLIGPLADLRSKYPQEKMIPAMQRNLKRLHVLINQLLDLSKLEAGKLQPQLIQSNIAAYLQQLFASFESLAQSRAIIFNHEQSEYHKIGCFDEDKLDKIVTNLLSNAFKYTPDNGRVEVRADYTDTHLLLKIQDYGIGIEAERLPYIFDRFYQIEPKDARQLEGSGIGLSLVNELVDVMKGQIWVNSEPGAGSTFTVKLPIDQATWAEFAIQTKTSPTFYDPGAYELTVPTKPVDPILNEYDGQILLVVEDNPDLRAYIRTIFDETFLVIEAVDGLEGLSKAFEYSPDIVISDVMMPIMDGFDMCRKIKTDARSSHIPVVLLTAKASLKDRLEGLELGADDYLEKPFSKAELQVRVRNLLKIRAELREKYSIQVANYGSRQEAIPEPVGPDELFLKEAIRVVEAHMHDSKFKVDQFCELMQVSRTNMHRKLKALANQSTTEFIRNMRLYRAATLLKNREGSISEVAYKVGFESLSYFSRSFQEQIGYSPTEWVAKH